MAEQSPTPEELEASQEADPEDSAIAAVARSGFITDYASGEQVRATPEEVEGTQVLSRRLVEDYGYPIAHLQTRPQFRVRRRPSDEGRSFPVDIALFRGPRKMEDNLYLIAECKEKTQKQGVKQLKRYMDLSSAVLGVWFNGNEHTYLRKIYHPDGTITYQEIPNIPRFGQRVEDVGLYRRRDLKPASNLKAVFRDLRNYLAGNTTGITRDETLAQEIINLLFCKIYDEIYTTPDDTVTFRSGVGEDPQQVKDRIVNLFEDVKNEYNDVFSASDTITLPADNLVYVVGELQTYCVTGVAPVRWTLDHWARCP